jgi:serine acetyltransferase
MLRIFRILHRIGNLLIRVKLLYIIYGVIYKIVLRIIYSMDFPLEVKIGKKLVIFHYYGIVLHKNTILGNNVTIRHGVTIGERKGGVPQIDDDVDIGAGAMILGKIFIGKGAKIGAGAIVLHDVQPFHTVRGPYAS